MKTTYNKIGLIIFFINGFSIIASANGEEYSKNISRDFESNAHTTLEVNNKYGAIEIENWDKSSIHIDVKITVEHKDRQEAQKLLEMIDVEFSTEVNLVRAITKIEDNFGTSHLWLGIGSSGKKFSINYKITVPKSLNIKLKNKYGNILINEINGLAEIDVRYGNININKLTRGDIKPLNTIIVGYGKAFFEECNWLKFNISYSKANIQKCKALVLVSKYSKTFIEKASSVVVDSEYDEINIGTLSNFVVAGKYSTYNMRSLSKKLEAEIKYSGINVESIPATFESIKIENSYGKINLGIDAAASYFLNAYVRYAGIKYPENGRLNRIQENNSTTIEGTVGEGKSNATVNIKSSYGGVDLLK